MLMPCCPSAGPTGGAGVALPAGSCRVMTALTFFAIESYSPEGTPLDENTSPEGTLLGANAFPRRGPRWGEKTAPEGTPKGRLCLDNALDLQEVQLNGCLS